jgi:hypothetical protein
MHDLDLVAPYAAAIILYLIAPLLSRLVLFAISAVIAEGRNRVGDVQDQEIPYYLMPNVISDYVEYAMDAIQVIPALLLPVVGAVYGFAGGVPSPVSLSFLIVACVTAIALMAWILNKPPSDYVSRKWHAYSIITVGGILLNVVGIVLSLTLS